MMKEQRTKLIIVRFQMPGFHRWEGANKEVNYLGFMHRHVFFFECGAEVTHNERELEFMTVAKEVKEHLWDKFWHHDLDGLMFEGRSCESIAEEILDAFDYLEWVKVFEDNENGSVVAR